MRAHSPAPPRCRPVWPGTSEPGRGRRGSLPGPRCPVGRSWTSSPRVGLTRLRRSHALQPRRPVRRSGRPAHAEWAGALQRLHAPGDRYLHQSDLGAPRPGVCLRY